MEYTTNGTDLKQKTHAVLSDEKSGWLLVFLGVLIGHGIYPLVI